MDECVNDEMLDDGAGIEFVEGAKPVIELLDFPYKAEELLATVVRGYGQVYNTHITLTEVHHNLDELQKTKLKTPLSFLNSVWLIKNVTRAWANQMVRYRVGTSFVQESLRFSVAERTRVLLPQGLTPAAEAEYRAGARAAVGAYRRAMMLGGEVQDARGLLPLNTLTSLFASINLQTLAHIYEQRHCCQAQAEEWTPMVEAMKEMIGEESAVVASFLEAPWENPNCVTCGFGAAFDRPCKMKHLFDRNLIAMANKNLTGLVLVGTPPEGE
jgi:hypothetical protein